MENNGFIDYDALFLFRWFEGFNWDGLCKGTLNPPLLPKVSQLAYCFFVIIIATVTRDVSLFFSSRLSILWTAVHVIVTPRARWSCAQAGMISDGPVRQYFITFRLSPHK